MPVQVNVEFPEDVFVTLREDPEAFARELRLAAVIKWFEMGRISQGKAAELAGLSRTAFIDALARYDVSPFQLSPEALAEEMSEAEPPSDE